MSSFLTNIRQVVPLNFQQSFSTVVWKAEFSAVNFPQLIGKRQGLPKNLQDTPYSHTSVRNQSNSAPVKIYVSVWISSKMRKLLRNAQF